MRKSRSKGNATSGIAGPAITAPTQTRNLGRYNDYLAATCLRLTSKSEYGKRLALILLEEAPLDLLPLL